MTGVLVVAEHRQGQLRDVTLELVTAGRELGGPVAVAVVASDPSAFHGAVDVEGVDEILDVTVGQDEFENDVYQTAVEAILTDRQPDAVLMGFTVNSMGYASAIAAKTGAGFASDVFGLSQEDGQIVVQRAMYGGKVHAEIELPAGRPAILLLRPTTWQPAGGSGGATTTVFSVPEQPRSRARHREFVEVQASDVDITTADFLLSIGRGIESKDKVPYFEELAGKMSATLSGSRPLIDSGWLPSARQVGQSGKTVQPKVYLALGISGAVQHIAGMKTADTIIAINTDPEASIFTVADYGAVADLFDVAEALEQLY